MNKRKSWVKLVAMILVVAMVLTFVASMIFVIVQMARYGY